MVPGFVARQRGGMLIAYKGMRELMRGICSPPAFYLAPAASLLIAKVMLPGGGGGGGGG